MQNKFPERVLPPVIDMYVRELASTSGTSDSFVALGVLAATNVLAAGSDLVVKYGYKILPNMYMSVVAQKGYNKSNSLNAPIAHMVDHEHEVWSEYEKDRKAHEAKMANASKKEKAELQDDQPIPPMTNIITKATTEGLKERLSVNEQHDHPAFAFHPQ